MICFIALFVFAVLGIFSAKYRKLAKEAFDCVFRKITLRKCDTGLDARIKSKLTGKLLAKSPKVGGFVFKHFEIISWAFTLLFIASFVLSILGGVNFYLYGNCNGPNKDTFCIFDPSGENSKVSQSESAACPVTPSTPEMLTQEGFNLSLFPSSNSRAMNTVLFIGCYACPYTREAYPTIMRLQEEPNTAFYFAHFPVKGVTENLTFIGNCIYKEDPERFWEMNDFLFAETIDGLSQEETAWNYISTRGMDVEKIRACAESPQAKELYDRQLAAITATNIYGTPLVFVNGEPVVGPKPYRVYKRLLK